VRGRGERGCRGCRGRRARGSVLFEVVLAIALFVGTGAFVLGATRSAITTLDRARREARAADLATSRMAELAAGLVDLADLRNDRIEGVGTLDLAALDEAGWWIEGSTERSEVDGFVLVEVTAGHGADGDAVTFAIRQLVRIDRSEPQPYPEDELVRDLPEGSP